jgi:selenocysteine lyase/cysteine desulfurase
MANIYAHETYLNSFLTDKLLAQYGDSGWFRILGPQDADQRGGILTFEVKDQTQ